MKLTAKQKNRVEELKDEITCSYDFICLSKENPRQCQTEDIGIEDFVICLEKRGYLCEFSTFFGESVFCSCPVRVFLAKGAGS